MVAEDLTEESLGTDNQVRSIESAVRSILGMRFASQRVERVASQRRLADATADEEALAQESVRAYVRCVVEHDIRNAC